MITIDYKRLIRERNWWFFGYRLEYAEAIALDFNGHWRLHWNGSASEYSFAIAEWLQERFDKWA